MDQPLQERQLKRELRLTDLTLMQVLLIVGLTRTGIVVVEGGTHVFLWFAGILSFYVSLAGLLPNAEVGNFPSAPRRGDRDLNKISRSHLYGAGGVVIKFHRMLLSLNTTTSARANDAGRLFLIAQPPLLGEEGKFANPLFKQQALVAGAMFLRPSGPITD